MIAGFVSILTCIRDAHDPRLMLAAGLVCAIGVYASFAICNHAARSTGGARTGWSLIGITAGGSTAWATRFIILLAFKPGMPSAFEPVLTATSLLSVLAGIGLGVSLSIRTRRQSVRFAAGVILGSGIASLHYVGLAAYLVQGTITWNFWLVIPSVVVALCLSGLAMVVLASRVRRIRPFGAPVFLLSVAILHFPGMAAMSLHADPARRFPPDAISPAAITPIVAWVSLVLLMLAVLGWRLDLDAKARVRRDRRRLRELADVALEGLLICRGDVIVTANDSVELLSGYPLESLAGMSVSALLPGLDIAGLPEREEREIELFDARGKAVPVRVLRRDVGLGHKTQTVIALRDQRERLRTEARIRSLAFSDPLTGLSNRTRFFDLLSVHAASRRERDQGFAVLMLDLDRFKQVNDTYGHAIGDRVLRMVADRLTATLRTDDVVARLGGDEFAILLLATSERAIVLTTAERLVAVICQPFMIDGQLIHIGTSIGIALSPKQGGDPGELMHDADLALYAAKSEKRTGVRFFDIALDQRARERSALEAGLRQALTNGELELAYQPLIDTATNRITSAEALLRWNHPERGRISPADFIPLAEETGLIISIGAWVLHTACAEAASWPGHLCVAVNLSPVQLRDRSLVSVVASALVAAALPAERLELEITEGVLLSYEEDTLRLLNELRALGVRISMDDFGTGYSSLSYLRKFPFDKIKIDQSFIRQAPDDPGSAAIVRAIITMGACLGISTTVEGVETQQQFAFSVREGCDSIQGFHVSRPLGRAEFARLIAQAAGVPALA